MTTLRDIFVQADEAEVLAAMARLYERTAIPRSVTSRARAGRTVAAVADQVRRMVRRGKDAGSQFVG